MEVLESVAADYIRKATKATTQKAEMTAYRNFEAFEWDYRHERPVLWVEPRQAYDVDASVHNEITCCMFAAWLDQIFPATLRFLCGRKSWIGCKSNSTN